MGETSTGTVLNINPDRNFGFIKPTDGGSNVFFYFNSSPEVKPGDLVSFEMSVRKKDSKTYAHNLQIISKDSEPTQDSSKSPSRTLTQSNGSEVGLATSSNVPTGIAPMRAKSLPAFNPPIYLPHGPRPPYFGEYNRFHPQPRFLNSSTMLATFQGYEVPYQNSTSVSQQMNIYNVPLVPNDFDPLNNQIPLDSDSFIRIQNELNDNDNWRRSSVDAVNPQTSFQINSQVLPGGENQNAPTQVIQGAQHPGPNNVKQTASVDVRTIDVKIKFVRTEIFIAEAVTKLPDLYKEGATVCIKRALLKPFDSLLQKDDILKVILAAQNIEKPFATKADVARCSKFTEEQLNSFMVICANILGKNSSSSLAKTQTIFDLIHVTSVWEAALSCDNIQADTFHQLIKYFIRIANQISGSEVSLFFDKIMTTRLFHPLRGTCICFSSNYKEDKKKLQELKEFLDCALLVHSPSRCARFLKLMEEVCPEGEKFWIQALRKFLRAGNSKDDDIGVLEWKELPLAPTVKEIMGNVMEDEINLTPVPLGKAFPSNEQYYDTYIRLLREDCFFAIKTGIKKFLNKSLDPRDMNVYVNVEMLGYVLNETGVNIVLQLKTTSNVTKGGFRPNDLQHGNLLCVSAVGSFKDPVAGLSLRDVRCAAQVNRPICSFKLY